MPDPTPLHHPRRASRTVRPRLLLPTLLLALLPATALAQSEAELRADNEALRARIVDIELELKAARARIAELERQLEEARKRAASGGGAGDGSVPPPVVVESTLDESVPSASPRALLAALRLEYAEAMGPVGGWATPRERTVYFRALERWVAATNRRHRTSIDWVVRVEEVQRVADRATTLRVVAVDPVKLIELGDSFPLALGTAQFRRLDAGGLAAPGTLLRVRGTLVPAVAINDTRESPGTFEFPRLVGPFVDFGLALEASSAVPFREEVPAAPAAPAPPAAPPVTP